MQKNMYSKNENIVGRKVHDTCFLIDITENFLDEKCKLYETSEVGLFIWDCFDETFDAEVIAKKLVLQLTEPVDFEIVRDDVIDFMQMLCAQGFIEER